MYTVERHNFTKPNLAYYRLCSRDNPNAMKEYEQKLQRWKLEHAQLLNHLQADRKEPGMYGIGIACGPYIPLKGAPMSETKAERKERVSEEADDEAAEIRAEDRASARSFKGAVPKQNVSAPGSVATEAKTPYNKTVEGGEPVPNPMRGPHTPLPGIR